MTENTAVFAARDRALGGSIRLITSPGGGHYPHGLADPAPLVAFIPRYAESGLAMGT